LNEIKSPGAHAPERCISPKEFVMNFLDIEAFGDIWMTFTQKMSGEIT
jgi:hypothetical protein